MRSRALWRVLAVVLAFAFIAAACGDDDDDTEAAGSTTSAETTEPAETTAAPATSAAAETTEAAAETTEATGGGAGDGELKIGYILPQTGALSAIIDALLKPIEMGEQEITEAGGSFTLTGVDSGTDPDIASTNIDQLLNDNVDVILGPASTTVTLAVIDKVTGSGIVECSGSTTGSVFTTYDDGGFYFRTSPPDGLQGPALADVITDDGATSVGILVRNDEYGVGFGDAIAGGLEANGVTVAANIPYDFNATSFDAEIGQLTAAGVDAVVMISFAEGAAIMQGLIEAGLGPSDVAVYVADGFKDNVAAADVDPNNPAVLEGIRGTAPSAAPPNGEPTFLDRLDAFAPGTPTIFSAHFYDCLMITVLSSLVAGSDDPAAIQAEMIGVTKDGTKCSSYTDCVALIDAGEDIDYDGASGPLEFTDAGEPGTGVYDVFEYDAEGNAQTETQVEIGG